MKHRKKGKKFGRERGQRRAFMQGLAANLILHENIETTPTRAKALRPKVEKLVTVAKKQDLASLRLLLARLPRRAALRLFYDIAPRYQDRNGGYTRIIKMSARSKRDGAEKAKIEFI